MRQFDVSRRFVTGTAAVATAAAAYLFLTPPLAACEPAVPEACVEGTGVPERDYQACTQAIASCGKTGVELATLHVARGLALAAVGAHDKAILDFAGALELNPYSAAALHARGLSHQAAARWAASIADFDQAIALFPRYFNGFRHRGTTRLLSGDLEGALADFNKAIGLDRSKPSVYMLRGIARYLLGPEAAAVADFERTAQMAYPQTHLDIWRLLARRAAGADAAKVLPPIPSELDADAPPWLGPLTRRITGGGAAEAVWATIDAVAPARREAAVEVVSFYLALDARGPGRGGGGPGPAGARHARRTPPKHRRRASPGPVGQGRLR